MDEVPLPVELLSFHAKANSNQAVLTWATASETNNDKFVIEKSDNGTQWTVAGEVKGNGTTNTMHSYNFTDNAISAHQYYRLKQVDLNGAFSYSNIELVTFGRKTNTPVTLLANPIREQIQFNLNGNVLNQAILEIYSTAGVLVKKQILTEGNLQNGINISNLAPGIYLYKISEAQQILGSDRIIKTN